MSIHRPANPQYFNDLAAIIDKKLEEIRRFCISRALPQPVVVAASKKRSVDEIKTARQIEILHFGENYVQEAQQKHAEGAYKGATLHLIGHLQSNKAKQAAEIFDAFHGLDSPKLANALQKACAALGKTMDVLIQVNFAGEQQKGGVSPQDLEPLVQHICETCENLRLTGLMVMPPLNVDPTPFFQQGKQAQEKLGLPHLSMGMSGDWQVALLEGATHIRLGTALFGPRN